MTGLRIFVLFVLFILYALYLEYDRTLYPLRLRASRLDGGAPPPLPCTGLRILMSSNSIFRRVHGLGVRFVEQLSYNSLRLSESPPCRSPLLAVRPSRRPSSQPQVLLLLEVSVHSLIETCPKSPARKICLPKRRDEMSRDLLKSRLVCCQECGGCGPCGATCRKGSRQYRHHRVLGSSTHLSRRL